jgi:hypothetical protein
MYLIIYVCVCAYMYVRTYIRAVGFAFAQDTFLHVRMYVRMHVCMDVPLGSLLFKMKFFAFVCSIYYTLSTLCKRALVCMCVCMYVYMCLRYIELILETWNTPRRERLFTAPLYV